MTRSIGRQAPVTLLALVALLAALLLAPAGDTAPGDVADLSVTKADTPDPVFVGAPLTYTVQVRNLGPQGATGVSLTDRLPNQTDFVSAAISQGNCEQQGSRVTCEIGNLASDPTGANAVTATIVVRPLRDRTLTNSAFVDSVENDPVKANDTSTVTTTVLALEQAPRCRGFRATRVGTPGADRIFGTTGPDVIVGLGGGDRIVSRSGRDLICANGGNDNVIAGTAKDRVFAGGGADRVKGRGGPDVLAGNRGRDILKGNAGSDRLRGNRGFDRCYGGAGADSERGCER